MREVAARLNQDQRSRYVPGLTQKPASWEVRVPKTGLYQRKSFERLDIRVAATSISAQLICWGAHGSVVRPFKRDSPRLLRRPKPIVCDAVNENERYTNAGDEYADLVSFTPGPIRAV